MIEPFVLLQPNVEIYIVHRKKKKKNKKEAPYPWNHEEYPNTC